jgi:hypothetical protein
MGTNSRQHFAVLQSVTCGACMGVRASRRTTFSACMHTPSNGGIAGLRGVDEAAQPSRKAGRWQRLLFAGTHPQGCRYHAPSFGARIRAPLPEVRSAPETRDTAWPRPHCPLPYFQAPARGGRGLALPHPRGHRVRHLRRPRVPKLPLKQRRKQKQNSICVANATVWCVPTCAAPDRFVHRVLPECVTCTSTQNWCTSSWANTATLWCLARLLKQKSPSRSTPTTTRVVC